MKKNDINRKFSGKIFRKNENIEANLQNDKKELIKSPFYEDNKEKQEIKNLVDFKNEDKLKLHFNKDKFNFRKHDFIETEGNPSTSRQIVENEKSNCKSGYVNIEENSNLVAFSEVSLNLPLNRSFNLPRNRFFRNPNKDSDSDSENTETIQNVFLYRTCLICDLFFNFGSLIFDECNHHFCFRCLRAFYEEKIEMGDKNKKCPIFNCKVEFKNRILKEVLSKKYFDSFSSKINLNENSKSVKIRVDFSTKSIENANFLTQKHIFHLVKNDNLQYFNKFKDSFCQKCHEYSIFTRTGKNFVKCLNCLNSSCKYCGSSFSNDHFDLQSFRYCKVYFRRKLSEYSSKITVSNFKEFLIYCLLYIAVYFIVIIGSMSYVNQILDNFFFTKNNENRIIYSFKIILFYILNILVGIIIIICSILLVSLFPAFSSVFG